MSIIRSLKIAGKLTPVSQREIPPTDEPQPLEFDWLTTKFFAFVKTPRVEYHVAINYFNGVGSKLPCEIETGHWHYGIASTPHESDSGIPFIVDHGCTKEFDDAKARDFLERRLLELISTPSPAEAP